MKVVLISIRPQHLFNIVIGKKTRELRSMFPSDFRGWAFAYCTKAIKAKPTLIRSAFNHSYRLGTCYVDGFEINLSGKVVCRFFVNNVEEIDTNLGYPSIYVKACVQDQEAIEYAKGKTVKVISISKLEVFDKPKELREFYKDAIYGNTDEHYKEVELGWHPINQVTRAPQSWQYVYIQDLL